FAAPYGFGEHSGDRVGNRAPPGDPRGALRSAQPGLVLIDETEQRTARPKCAQEPRGDRLEHFAKRAALPGERFDLPLDLVDTGGDRREVEVVFRREVSIERSFADTGPRRDVVHQHAVKVACREDLT